MIWWMIAAVCAFFVKGLCGFANTLVFTAVMSFGVSNIAISPVELLLGYPTNALIAWRERKSIEWRLCLPLAALVVLGSIPGMLLLKNADAGAIKALFGVLIVALGLEMLLRGRKGSGEKESRGSRTVLAVIGLLSGVLCGLFGVGALLGAYVGRTAKNSSAFRANLCFVFFVENTLRIVTYTAAGILHAGLLGQAAMLVPFMLLGLYLGFAACGRLNERVVQKAVVVMLIISGMVLIAGNI